ncbi:hypothetical protein PRIC1_011950 [Phytophthora ramorum]
MATKHALHPMSDIIKPGSMTLILANPGAGKSTFLKALAGKLQDNSQTEIGDEILYSGLKGEEIDLIKLAGLVDQTDNHIPTLTVRETFKFADMCVNGRPEDLGPGELCGHGGEQRAAARCERRRMTVGKVLSGGRRTCQLQPAPAPRTTGSRSALRASAAGG